ncbi:YcaO-like family protein [Clostridium hydrogenum]|uniref:YcaO-like family protein n=1 Tax=Clostridium hydrogenum TaxID=2855764 RepID=UPI001F27D811|nr:YcaO-like family protein [Clostridium hydrogenum]
MDNRLEKHYKNEKPEVTVNFIKDILKNLGAEVTEEWMPVSSAQTYSLRVSFKGTSIGSNGKGITKEYARASAYAELMERLQNRWIRKFYFKKGYLEGHKNYYITPDEKLMTTDEVASLDSVFFDMLFQKCNLSDLSYENKLEVLQNLHKFELEVTGEGDLWVMVPFYSVRKKDVVYIPYFLYTCIYGSNGMCAGNTAREALIQGFSEVIERYVQNEIVKNSYALPDYKYEEIAKFPEIESRLKSLEKLSDYRFVLKDCSLGGKFPVVALASIELDKGNYGLKFGCHPDIGIAMERVLTETSQGMDFNQYCKKSKFNFGNDIVKTDDNFSNICHTGRGQYPYEVFSDKPSFDFSKCKDIQNRNDKDIIDYIINDVIDEKYDIYIRDSSILGFPSYHIIIPFMSEMNHMDEKKFKNIALKYAISDLINRPSEINLYNVRYLGYILKNFGTNDMHSSLVSLSGTLLHTENYPAENVGLGWLYMLILCEVMQEKYEIAYTYMEKFMSILPKQDRKEMRFYNAMKDYLHGRSIDLSHDKVISYLTYFYSSKVCKWLNESFCDPKLVFVKLFSNHIMDKKTCTESKCCDYYFYKDICEKLRTKEKVMIDQNRLKELFSC